MQMDSQFQIALQSFTAQARKGRDLPPSCKRRSFSFCKTPVLGGGKEEAHNSMGVALPHQEAGHSQNSSLGGRHSPPV